MSKIKELKERKQALQDEMRYLSEKDVLTPGEDQRLSRVVAGYDKISSELREATEQLKSQVTERTAGYDDGKSLTYWKQSTRAEVFGLESHDSRVKADNAKRAAEFLQADTGLEVRGDVIASFDRQGGWADCFRRLADNNYATGWAKVIQHGEGGALLRMTDAERQAMERAARVEKRDMSLTDSQGGWMVPAAVDPSILISGTGAVSSLRSLARVVTAVSDNWRGVSSAGATATFTPEAAEASDGSPTLDSVLIEAHKAVCWIPYTFEVAEDAVTLLDQLRSLMSDARDVLEADKFLNGTGVNEPYGLLTRLEANTSADVVVTTAGQIGAVDIYNLAAALPPRFRPNASWMASMSTLNAIRAISDDRLGNYVTDLRSGYNFQLLGRPVYEASDMDAMVNGTAAATFAVFGDFSKAYTIFDRLGSGRVSVVPHLMGQTSGTPVGMAGLYYHWRVGADVLSGNTSGENCARILVNKTS